MDLVMGIAVIVLAQPLWCVGMVFGLMLCTTVIGIPFGLLIVAMCWIGMVTTWRSSRELMGARR
jgi:ABC-type spermidine/putrescine transport system permease subunit II